MSERAKVTVMVGGVEPLRTDLRDPVGPIRRSSGGEMVERRAEALLALAKRDLVPLPLRSEVWVDLTVSMARDPVARAT